jgi:cytochrome c
MFKLNTKLIVTASVVTVSALFTAATASQTASATSVASIDGGVMYPVVNGKTSAYKVNTQSQGMKINNGRVPTANELAAWDKDVMHDGTGLPEGSGSVEEGEEIYEAQCVMCHGDFGSGGGGYPALSKGNADGKIQKLMVQLVYLVHIGQLQVQCGGTSAMVCLIQNQKL